MAGCKIVIYFRSFDLLVLYRRGFLISSIDKLYFGGTKFSKTFKFQTCSEVKLSFSEKWLTKISGTPTHDEMEKAVEDAESPEPTTVLSENTT